MRAKSHPNLLALIALPILLLLSISVLAEDGNMIEVGDIRVHYNALPTRLLTPEVARQYGITRSANRALLNVSVLKSENGSSHGTPATVKASATNLNGQRQELRVMEVREADAVYYLAEARFQDRETLAFDLEVTPQGSTETIRARFQQQFFAQ